MRALGSLLVGGLVGAALVRVLAPQLTPQTRESLKRRIDELTEAYQARYGDLVEHGRLRATELMQSSRDVLDEQLAKGQDLVNTAVESARNGLDKVTSRESQQQF